MKTLTLVLLLLTAPGLLRADETNSEPRVSVASISPNDLVEYDSQPESIQRLIASALKLTTKKLGYQFGSNSPENSGMDCSGAVQCSLKWAGLDQKLPRTSYAFYNWAKAESTLTSARKAVSIDDPVFDSLKPGDLLFWEGTYVTKDRDPPISHVMIYLGTLKSDGQGVMFGASDGRRYRGKRITGVSVFDWKVPRPESTSKFVAFGPVPSLAESSEVEAAEVEEVKPDGRMPKKPVGKLMKTTLDKLFSRD